MLHENDIDLYTIHVRFIKEMCQYLKLYYILLYPNVNISEK